MTNFVLHTLVLVLGAFVSGCIVGCLLRSAFRRDDTDLAAAVPESDVATKPKAAAVEPASAEPKPASEEPEPPAAESAPTPVAGETDAASSPAPDPAPATETRPEPEPVDAPAAAAAPDDLKRIKGIGPAIERKLNAMGITRFEQIASWTPDDIERVDAELDFRGRIEREEWMEQAVGFSKSG